MRKYIQNKSNTCRAYMSPGGSFKNHLPLTEKTSQPVMIEPGREIKIEIFLQRSKIFTENYTTETLLMNRIIMSELIDMANRLQFGSVHQSKQKRLSNL